MHTVDHLRSISSNQQNDIGTWCLVKKNATQFHQLNSSAIGCACSLKFCTICHICESEKLLNLCAQKSWAQTVDEIDPLREKSDLKRQDSHYLLHPHPLLLSSTDQYTLYFRYLSLKDRISSNYKVLFSKCIYTPVFNSLVHAIYFKSLITVSVSGDTSPGVVRSVLFVLTVSNFCSLRQPWHALRRDNW